MQTRIRAMVFSCLGMVTWLVTVQLADMAGPSGTRRAMAQELVPPSRAATPVESNYAGTTKCAACHFSQFKDWKTSAHGKAFEILPTKYRDDASCLKCHLSGHGQLDQSNAQSSMVGVSCEACHGPGDEHVKIGLSLIGQDRELTEESLNLLRSKIERTAMDRCVNCHSAIAHKPHPEYDPEPSGNTRTRQSSGQKPLSGNFFQVHRP